MAKECRPPPITHKKGCARKLRVRLQKGAWLLQSWPWWIAGGLILVPFLAELWLLEWLLALGVFGGLWLISHRTRALSGAAILLVLGAIWGSCWGQLSLSNALPEALIKQDVWAKGTVQGLPQQRGRALRFKFSVESLEHESQAYAYSGDVLLNWYQPYPELKAGQRWRLKLRLKPAHGSLNPGGFNYAQWLFSQGILATGYVRETPAAILLEPASAVHQFDWIREQIQQFIDAQELEFGGLLNALSVGVRTGISVQQWQVFRDTGTAHLIAISGLHIGMVAGMAYLLGSWLWRHCLLERTQYPTQKVARLTAILAAVVYAALAGFSLPTLRAMLMLLAYFSLQYFRRNPGTLFSLGFVLLVVLMFNPLAPLGSGLWLSFSAVGAIALAMRGNAFTAQGVESQGMKRSFREKSELWFRQWWRVQWAVFIGLLPLTLLFFQQVSIVSLLANFIAIPAIASLVVPLVLLALLFLFTGLSVLSGYLLKVADTLLGCLWPLLEWLSGLPFSIWVSSSPVWWVVLICATGVVILLNPYIGRARYFGFLGFLPLFVVPAPVWKEGAVRLHVLDVGQGLSVVVETQGHALLYDAGAKYPSGFDVGSAVVIPFLRQQRITELDAVIASHDNLDHVGGMGSVLANHPSARRYSSAGFYSDSEPCEAGISWQWDGVRFRFLHPAPGNKGADNNDSCVLKVEGRFGSALLTGDIERETEQKLIQNTELTLHGVDVLLVPHHGSKTSSTETFIQAVDPALAVVSSGYLNRFKHPHQQVVDRYDVRNIRLLNTAGSGWIKIDIDQHGVYATPWRAVFKRYWLMGEEDL